MSEKRHTAAPWILRNRGDNDIIDIIQEGFDEGCAIASVSAWNDQQRIADAELIAAAPDLLEAATNAVEVLKNSKHDDTCAADCLDYKECDCGLDLRLEQLQVAIAKATGERNE